MCARVCVSVCMCVCLGVYAWVCVCVCVCVGVCVRGCVYVWTVWVCIVGEGEECVSVRFPCVTVCVHMCVVYTCACMYVVTDMQGYVCVRVRGRRNKRW